MRKIIMGIDDRIAFIFGVGSIIIFLYAVMAIMPDYGRYGLHSLNKYYFFVFTPLLLGTVGIWKAYRSLRKGSVDRIPIITCIFSMMSYLLSATWLAFYVLVQYPVRLQKHLASLSDTDPAYFPKPSLSGGVSHFFLTSFLCILILSLCFTALFPKNMPLKIARLRVGLIILFVINYLIVAPLLLMSGDR